MNQSMGTIISDARKSKNMTQAELAEVLHVTDKAVSKWERNICCPDITLISEIAKTLDISIEELLSGKIQQKNKPGLLKLVLTAVSFAMGIAVFILTVLEKLNLTNGLAVPNPTDMMGMLALGVILLAFLHLQEINL